MASTNSHPIAPEHAPGPSQPDGAGRDQSVTFIHPHRLANATRDDEMLEAINRRLSETRHVDIAEPHNVSATSLIVIGLLAAVPWLCLLVTFR